MKPTRSYLQESIRRGILDIEQHQIAFVSSIGAKRLPYRVVEDMAPNHLLNGGAKGFKSFEALMKSVAPGRKEMKEACVRLLGDDAEFHDPITLQREMRLFIHFCTLLLFFYMSSTT